MATSALHRPTVQRKNRGRHVLRSTFTGRGAKAAHSAAQKPFTEPNDETVNIGNDMAQLFRL